MASNSKIINAISLTLPCEAEDLLLFVSLFKEEIQIWSKYSELGIN